MGFAGTAASGTATRESSIEAGFVRAVAARGGLALKLVSPGSAGVPDRLVLMPGGVAGFIELKRPGQKPRPLQQRWLERLEALGFGAGWADSLAGALSWLDGLAPATRAAVAPATRAAVAPQAPGATKTPRKGSRVVRGAKGAPAPRTTRRRGDAR